MATQLVCWKCGASLAALPLPLGREAVCPACRAWLHACRLCQFYDPRLSSKCREDRAEEVRDREGANFCDWFKPRPGAWRAPRSDKAASAKASLEALFGNDAKEPNGSGSDSTDGSASR